MWQYLYNVHFSFLDNLLIWLNLVGAIYAVCVNHRAASRGLPTHRPVYAGISFVAAAYVVMFVLFIIVEPPFKHWYSILRGLGVIAWFFVWAAPGRKSMATWKRIETAVDAQALAKVGEVERDQGEDR